MLARRGPGLVGMAARTAVVAGTATAVSGRVHHRQQEKYAAQEGQQMQQQQMQAAPPPAEEEDPLVQIQKLSVLKEQGVLTEEEFTAAKAQILGI